MKNLLTVLALIFATSSNLQADDKTLSLNNDASSVPCTFRWSDGDIMIAYLEDPIVSKFTDKDQEGFFNTYNSSISGDLRWDDFSPRSFHFTIDLSNFRNIHNGDEKVIHGDNLILYFTSSGLSYLGNDFYLVSGHVTVKEITKFVEFPIELKTFAFCEGKCESYLDQTVKANLSGSLKIDLNDFMHWVTIREMNFIGPIGEIELNFVY